MNEIWRPCPDYEGLYEVSNLGRVKSLPRNGTINEPRIIIQRLKGLPNHKVFQVGLNKNDKKRMHSVHRLVAKAFIGNPDNKPCVNHKDGNPRNNNIDNLEWVTYSENMKHAFKTGLHSLKGDKHNNRKLNSEDVRQIRLLNGKMYQREIAEKYGVSRTLITRILNNHNWKTI